MAAKKDCLNCGDQFIGRANAAYCSPACKQRAHRSKGGNRNAKTVTVTAAEPVVAAALGGVVEHSGEALSVLAALDAELAAASRRRGLVKPMKWSAAEATLRDMLANAIDRKVVLHASWMATTDDHLRVKLSAEIRLLEASVARYLGQIKTDLPADLSTTSSKAQRAANTRWERDRARS